MAFQTHALCWFHWNTLFACFGVIYTDGKLLDFSPNAHSTFYLYKRSCTSIIYIRSIYIVCSAHARTLVKAWSTEWSMCLELAVFKRLSGDKVSSSTVYYIALYNIVYASTYSVVYHACSTQRLTTQWACFITNFTKNLIALPLAVHAHAG